MNIILTIIYERGYMLELIMMSLLGVAYINACKEEAKEEKRLKEERELRLRKRKIFLYAIKHQMLYDDVVSKINNNELTFEEIDND